MTLDDAIKIARNLKSEHGENIEYDRALVEFINDGWGSGPEAIAKDLSLDFHALYPSEPTGLHIIIVGSPVDGLSLVGPFTDASEAVDYASEELHDDTWWVSSVEKPTPEERDTPE